MIRIKPPPFSEESLLNAALIHRKSLEQILIKIACGRASLSDKYGRLGKT